jgi:hypothetical protein
VREPHPRCRLEVKELLLSPRQRGSRSNAPGEDGTCHFVPESDLPSASWP